VLTREEMREEFWLLTKGILQDGRVDFDEARVIKRWIEEHDSKGEFSLVRSKLEKFLEDRIIDPRESAVIAETIGRVLSMLRGIVIR